MRVFEIFHSIQGETSHVGLPMGFVRLAGCDLAARVMARGLGLLGIETIERM